MAVGKLHQDSKETGFVISWVEEGVISWFMSKKVLFFFLGVFFCSENINILRLALLVGLYDTLISGSSLSS